MYQEDKARQPSVTGFPVPYPGPSSAAANYNSSTAPPPPPPAPYSASTVSYQQPPPPPPPKTLEGWTTGLCDCFDDPGNCCITCCCPCVTFGRIAEIVDKGSSSCGACGILYTVICCLTGGCGFLLSCSYRSKMRRQLNLRGSDCGDFLVHCCCEHCALCQDYRELQNRGFRMDMGWHGNEQRTGGIAMNAPPAAEHGMRR